jgi:hypothetical protein
MVSCVVLAGEHNEHEHFERQAATLRRPALVETDDRERKTKGREKARRLLADDATGQIVQLPERCLTTVQLSE